MIFLSKPIINGSLLHRAVIQRSATKIETISHNTRGKRPFWGLFPDKWTLPSRSGMVSFAPLHCVHLLHDQLNWNGPFYNCIGSYYNNAVSFCTSILIKGCQHTSQQVYWLHDESFLMNCSKFLHFTLIVMFYILWHITYYYVFWIQVLCRIYVCRYLILTPFVFPLSYSVFWEEGILLCLFCYVFVF